MTNKKYAGGFGREFGRIREKILDYTASINYYYGATALVTKASHDLMLVDFQGELFDGPEDSVEELLQKAVGRQSDGYALWPVQLESIADDSPGAALQDEQAVGFLAIPAWQSGLSCGLAGLATYLNTYNERGFLPEQLLPDGILLMDVHGQSLSSNFVADYMLRRAGIDNVSNQAIDVLLGHAERCLAKEVGVYYPKLDGFDVLVLALPLWAGDDLEGCMYIFSDISMQKRSEKELIEKSTVIREIHHRVKNNLQTITSLLRLQIRRSNQRILEKSFNESINRILSIALIHEALSRQDIEVINVKQTSYNILQTILSNMVDPGKEILGSVSGDDVFLPSETASSICLCITELVQNALEHAFIGRDDGNIRIDFSHAEGMIRIKVADNGTGIKKQPEKSLGIEIVNTIVGRKLRGGFRLDSDRYGTSAVIEFKDDGEHMAEN